jgi:alpha-amylase/alpha-mannosidase (GH57 family)
MLYLAFIYHMHQPYYKNLLTDDCRFPWVRLHGIKDYLDMVEILQGYPQIHQTFNLVPSLLEQIEDYLKGNVRDYFLMLSAKPAAELSEEEKRFILEHFFMADPERVISAHPRYFELYAQKKRGGNFTTQDYLDLQVWFNLAWTDPIFRESDPGLKALVNKARFFSEQEKQLCLDAQEGILRRIIPAYKKFRETGQIEVTVSPFYHPILPLLYNTTVAKQANLKTILPKTVFSFPQDAEAQVRLAVEFYRQRFGAAPLGMWPSEESVSEHILPAIIKSGINWIVADEAILFKTLKKKKRNAELVYKPYTLKRKDGTLNIVFRDRNLSDLLSFQYHHWSAEDAVTDLMKHFANIHNAFAGENPLVVIAMDGENAWEYFRNDGCEFLNLLYKRISQEKYISSVTVSEYLKAYPPSENLKQIEPGSWIYGNFNKWIGNPYKNLAWEYLAAARQEFERILSDDNKRLALGDKLSLAWKQMYIAEGSDWFWWYGDDHGYFDHLFRMHLSNFYTIIGKGIPEYLNRPLNP